MDVHPAKVYWQLKEYEQDCFFPCFYHTVIVRFMDNSYVPLPPADSLAAPVNHGGKVDSKDTGMHAHQFAEDNASTLLQLITSVFLAFY